LGRTGRFAAILALRHLASAQRSLALSIPH
jgi:hypothetical protein